EVEDVRDVDVLELDGDLRLVDQHLHEVIVRGEVRVDHLQRDQLLEALEALGRREVNLRHPAGGDLLNEPIRTELPPRLSDRFRHRSRPHAAFTPPDWAGWCAAAWPG